MFDQCRKYLFIDFLTCHVTLFQALFLQVSPFLATSFHFFFTGLSIFSVRASYSDFTISGNVFQAVFVFFQLFFLLNIIIITFPPKQTNQLILCFPLPFVFHFLFIFG